MCPNVKQLMGGLDQYGAERFGRLIFATIRKSVGLKELQINNHPFDILAIILSLKIPAHLECVATLPCDMSAFH